MAKKTANKRKNFGFRHVVKRRGHNEKFDERKLYASVYETCHAAGLTTKQAERMSEKVSAHVKKWMEKKDAISAHEIHREAGKALTKTHADAGYLYTHHKDVC